MKTCRYGKRLHLKGINQNEKKSYFANAPV